MISAPRNSNSHLASAWVSGIACLFLAIGGSGAITPLLPEEPFATLQGDLGDNVMLEEFSAASAAPAPSVEQPETQELIEDVEIPPLPDITPPLTPPEMTELTPLEPVVQRPASPAPKPAETKSRPNTANRAATRPGTQSTAQGTGIGGGGGGEPQLFTGAGGGRFPAPYYPPTARMDGKQGTLRLLVTVEANGVPSSVSVSASSGHSILDSAARDHVQRRWRWPFGVVRRYIVPVRYVLE